MNIWILDKGMKRLACLLMTLSILFLQGCNSRQVYNSIQHNIRLECRKAPISEYDKCIEQASETYDDYKTKREAVINDK